MRRAVARLRARRHSDEAGFTLVELLIAVIIQGLIVGALAMAFVVIMRGTTQTKASLDKTADARIAAQYIVSDARNSSGPELSLSDTSSCPDPSPPVAGTPTAVVRFNWNTTGSAGGTTANIVNYVRVGNSLLRRQCVGGTLVSDRAVASNVQSVAVACSPNADCSGNPNSITATVTSTTDAYGAGYSYSLTGTFRKSIETGPPATANGIIMLGGGGCTSGAATGLQVAGGADLTIYGNAKINTTDLSTCKAMSLGTNAGNYAAGGTQFLSGGTCTASGSSTCPTSTTYSPALADPYASLPVPSTSGMTARSGCPSGTAQPGVYASTLSIATACNFATGIYVFQNGLSITNSGAITNSSGGVFFYISGGTFSESGNATVDLTAMSTGLYSGVLMWHDGTSPITISNGGTFAMRGALYAPSAQVQFSGGSVTTTITSIVARSIKLSGGAVVSIGSPSTTPLSITSTSPLPGWTVNQPSYATTLDADGGDGQYIWAATNLPAGLSIDSSSGVISGKPTASGTKTVAVTLTDANGDTAATKNLSITINGAPSVSTASLTNAEIGASYSTTLAGSGGTTSYSWAATGLPSGLSINSSTGVIYGTPAGSTGTSTVVVTLTDTAGATANKNLSLTVVSAVTISTASLPNATNSVAYNQTVTATGGQTAYSWSATGLPAGLTMSTGGAITGTPTGSGTTTVNITVTDSLGGTDTDALSITVKPAISSVTLVNKSGGTAGTIEAGDSIKIVFSTAMKVSSICSAWANDAVDQSDATNNDVTVSANNVAGSDTITVAAASCPTLNFGTLSLGSTAYVTATRTYKGAGVNASIITWSVSTRTLTITLGTASGAAVNVSSSTPSWTPGAITDTAGSAIGNSPFTLVAGKQF